jgi:hypothetical protein
MNRKLGGEKKITQRQFEASLRAIEAARTPNDDNPTDRPAQLSLADPRAISPEEAAQLLSPAAAQPVSRSRWLYVQAIANTRLLAEFGPGAVRFAHTIVAAPDERAAYIAGQEWSDIEALADRAPYRPSIETRNDYAIPLPLVPDGIESALVRVTGPELDHMRLVVSHVIADGCEANRRRALAAIHDTLNIWLSDPARQR